MAEIQSLSIVVPTARCVNDCKFCVSKQHEEQYGPNLMDIRNPYFANAVEEYKKRMEYARDNGCNTVILTGTGEPTQNRTFLTTFGFINKSLEKPFRHITMQSSGAFLDADYIRFLRDHVGVNTISLSICSLDSKENAEYTGAPKVISLPPLCRAIKEAGVNLRISLNLTDAVEEVFNTTFIGEPKQGEMNALRVVGEVYNPIFSESEGVIFRELKRRFSPDQLTLRVLYTSGNTEQSEWVKKHAATPAFIQSLNNYIHHHGRMLEVLAHGKTKYDVNGITVVLDDDCMSTEAIENVRYLILRPNCKLYIKWDSKGSLLF